jgi:hypothetical protein
MNTRQPTLIEILQPRQVPANPKRTAVTRTILQPELDEFERLEALAAKSARVSERTAQSTTAR